MTTTATEVHPERRKLWVAVVEEGLPAEEQVGVPTHLPATPEEQWALLAPYVGRPVRDIPKGLVLLFTTPAGDKSSTALMQGILKLPAHQRQVSIASSSDSVFI